MNETEQTTEVFAKADAARPPNPCGRSGCIGTLNGRAAAHGYQAADSRPSGPGAAQPSLHRSTGLGSVVELDCSVNDPVEIVVNGRVIAEGEIVVVGGNYGVRITRIAGSGAETTLGAEQQLRQFSENLR